MKDCFSFTAINLVILDQIIFLFFLFLFPFFLQLVSFVLTVEN